MFEEADRCRSDEVVELSGGTVAGRRVDGVLRFLGIPYAAAERFLVSRPIEPWSGTLQAHRYGAACPQPPIKENLVIDPAVEQAMFGLADEEQSEDCLSLNVWSPAAGDGAARPVLVSFHGGGFKSGSGSARSAPWFDGTRLARRADAVVVTINHRIGVLGHLHLEQFEASGNLGLLDLVAGLQWLRANAPALGGDPDRVTIFGESGGGGKVMALMAMPSARGLFHRAICQSGALTWLALNEAQRVTEAVMDQLGVDSAEALAEIELGSLVAAGAAVTRSGLSFSPVIGTPELPCDAPSALAAGAASVVPLIIGVTRDEATAFISPGSTPGWGALEASFGERIVLYRALHPDADPRRALVELRTDEMFRLPALAAAGARAAHGGAPVFMYEFAWPTPVLGGSLGAAHGVDVAFPFDNTDLHPATAGSDSARRLASVVSDAWAAFARTGDPNHPGLPHWPAYDGPGGATMIFDNRRRVERRSTAPAKEEIRV
jgi:para-nitrobenzyl esterase